MTHLWRSLLFVPGDSDRKIAKVADSTADIIIFDLEDAVVPAARPAARVRVHDAVRARPSKHALCVRINPMDSADAPDDLDAVMPALPDYIMLPKVRSVADLDMLSERIAALETQQGVECGQTKVIALMTETPQMTLNLPTVTALPERVAALTWGGEDLSAELGATTNKDAHGHWTFTFQLARTQCLLAAKACGIRAIDTLYTNFRDEPGMREHADYARRDGFDGVLAIHPAQVESINDAFTPTLADIEHAQAIVDAFAKAPGQGTVQLNGRMLDKPHLRLAQDTLQRATG